MLIFYHFIFQESYTGICRWSAYSVTSSGQMITVVDFSVYIFCFYLKCSYNLPYIIQETITREISSKSISCKTITSFVLWTLHSLKFELLTVFGFQFQIDFYHWIGNSNENICVDCTKSIHELVKYHWIVTKLIPWILLSVNLWPKNFFWKPFRWRWFGKDLHAIQKGHNKCI
jgi:hypothetical protein